MLHARRQEEESWLEWHRRPWRESREQLAKTWGEDSPFSFLGGECGWRGRQVGAPPRCLGCGQSLAMALRGRRGHPADYRRAGSEPGAAGGQGGPGRGRKTLEFGPSLFTGGARSEGTRCTYWRPFQGCLP